MPDQNRARVVIAGHRGDTDLAREARQSPDPNVRQSAYNALARSGALDADGLASAVADSDAVVRLRAATIAGRYPDIDVDLVALLSDQDDSVVETAAWAAGERPLDDSVLAALIALAGDHPDALVRESAVASLGALQDERALPTIIAACEDKPTIRRRAVLALAPFSGPEVEATLERALTNKDWQTRQAAEDLLA